jgi:hypothetical protein
MAHKVQIAVEGEYISGAGIFANPGDGTNLKPYTGRLAEMPGHRYKSVTADANYKTPHNLFGSVQRECSFTGG